MNLLKKISILLFTLIILNGCVSVPDLSKEDLAIQEDAIFYIDKLGDRFDVANGIAKAVEDMGFKYQFITDVKEIPPSQTSFGTGSGFYISPNVIVTNAHVITDDNAISYLKNGIEYKAKLLYKNTQNDIAFLQTDTNVDYYFNISNKDNEIAESIFVLGFPITDILGEEIRVTNGIINSLSGLNGDKNLMQISAPIQPGNSGGPVINDNFEVVGIATSKLSEAYLLNEKDTLPQNINFAINSSLLKLFAQDYLKDNHNYVDTMTKAIQATVLIKNGGSVINANKQYYVNSAYSGYWDVVHYTLSYLEIVCFDIQDNKVIVDSSEDYYTLYSAETLANNQMQKVLYTISQFEKNKAITNKN